MIKLISTSVVGWALLSGVIYCAQAADATAPAMDVYDGFETPNLSNVWDTDKFVPGAVQMQTNIVRAGHSAAKITVHAKDKFEAGINGNNDSERAELSEAEDLISRWDFTAT